MSASKVLRKMNHLFGFYLIKKKSPTHHFSSSE